MKLLDEIKSPICIIENQFYLQHPNKKDIELTIKELQKEDLDLRRLVSVKNDSYQSRGKDWLESKWQQSLLLFQQNYPSLTIEKKQIEIQKEGLFKFQEIPPSGFTISDPFNMTPVEAQKTLNNLKIDQLHNCIVVSKDQEIVAFGRLLEVEGSVEIVSMWTKKIFRKQGIAAHVVKELLIRSQKIPLFSFQTVDLVPYYLKQYNNFFPSDICPFNKLPPALQRDLFRMNIFWGPNIIIRIGA